MGVTRDYVRRLLHVVGLGLIDSLTLSLVLGLVYGIIRGLLFFFPWLLHFTPRAVTGAAGACLIYILGSTVLAATRRYRAFVSRESVAGNEDA
jgi:hypothetical protein